MSRTNITDLSAYRTKKSLAGERKSSLQDSFALNDPQKSDFQPSDSRSLAPDSQFDRSDRDIARRIERLKSSINRINQLMHELRSPPNKDTK